MANLKTELQKAVKALGDVDESVADRIAEKLADAGYVSVEADPTATTKPAELKTGEAKK